MMHITRGKLFSIIAFLTILIGCGPFYSTLARYYLTEDRAEFTALFEGYRIHLSFEAVEMYNRQGTNDFYAFIGATSTSKFKECPDLDTVNAFRFEPVCIYYYESDSVACLEYKENFHYSIDWEKRIIQTALFCYEPVYIPDIYDSIRVDFEVKLYDNGSYSKILKQKRFETTLYRHFKKILPITR
jgi:hypothetical protein